MSGYSLNDTARKQRACGDTSVCTLTLECYILNTHVHCLIAMNDLVCSLKRSGGNPPFTPIDIVLWADDDKENES